jgi:hypothetical protein
VLRQNVELYRIYQEKIVDCDLQLRQHLESLGSTVDIQAQPIGPKPKGKKGSRNAPHFDLRTESFRSRSCAAAVRPIPGTCPNANRPWPGYLCSSYADVIGAEHFLQDAQGLPEILLRRRVIPLAEAQQSELRERAGAARA